MTPTTLMPWSPWVVMWTLAVIIFALCKWISWRSTPTERVAVWRHIAYLVAWPGLDAKAFLNSYPLPAKLHPSGKEWLFALVKVVFGAVLLWVVVPVLWKESPLLRGWVGMTGLIFLLHFGSFHLLSCAWRTVGIDAKPLMNWPILAQSVSEFWAKRWNLAFRDFTHRFLFRPLAAKLGPRGGLAAGFLFSGIVHDLVISLPAGGGYGLPTLYFVIQGFALLVERSSYGKQLGLGNGLRGCVFTAFVVIGPACGLFHPLFIREVVLPFLAVIGAK